MQYFIVPLILGVITGLVGSRKGGSYLLWMVIGFLLPIIGLVAAILSRDETIDPRRECPKCGRLSPITTQVCTGCGTDLFYPDELVIPEAYDTPQGRAAIAGSSTGDPDEAL